ncbi:double-headed protease inhibitor, submandibular gland-like [Phoenicopterus ruber ruber]
MYQGSGKSLVACPRNYEPVCGTNGVTYPNECSLCREMFRNRALDKKHDGRCVKLDCTGYLRSRPGQTIPCGLDYMPICGTNGITYRNKCNFCNAVASGLDLNLLSMGECRQPMVPPPGDQWKWPGQPGTVDTIDCGNQSDGNSICTAEYNPVCGSDGRTYGNHCQFCNAFS